MSKTAIKKTVSKQLQEVEEVVISISEHHESIEKIKEEDSHRVAEINKSIEEAKESLQASDDVEEAKQHKDKINELNENLELQQSVSNSKINKLKQEIAELFKDFTKAYNTASQEYNKLDDFYTVNVSVSNMEEYRKDIHSYGVALDNKLKRAKSVLMDTGLIDSTDVRYQNFHLSKTNKATYAKFQSVYKVLKPFGLKFR